MQLIKKRTHPSIRATKPNSHCKEHRFWWRSSNSFVALSDNKGNKFDDIWLIGAFFFFTCFLWPCAWSRRWPSWRASRWTGRSHCLQTAACRSNTSTHRSMNPEESRTLQQVTPALLPRGSGSRYAEKVSNHPRVLAKGQLPFTYRVSRLHTFFIRFFFFPKQVKREKVSRCDPWQLPPACRGNERKRGDIFFFF